MIKELYEEYFNGLKITVMGLGVLGRGLGDTQFLAENGANLIVTDKKNKEYLASSLKLLEAYPSIVYHLGGHDKADFEKRDFILKAAGVPYDSEYVFHAKKNNVPVYMSAALLADIVMKRLKGVTVIGITGTRGKSTVTQLVAHVLSTAGLRVFLAGNVRGVANLPILAAIEDGDYLVLELDSWQLQGFGDMKISPHIAVFTSFMDDHMNYYKNDRELYFKDKANIYNHQTDYDVLIASTQAASEILKRDKIEITIPDQQHFEMNLIGEHNQVAASLAYEVALQCGIEDEQIKNSIKSFPGVEGRLQDLGFFGGSKKIRVFNDNNATTGDATIAAIDAINTTYKKKPILIFGGSDKGLSLDLLEQTILISVKKCIFLDGTGTAHLTLTKDLIFQTLSECVDKAFEIAEPDDVILFSPAFASFSKEFNNEYERNDAFVRSVQKYL